MKIVDVKTERILDTNPNIYLERAEEKLRNKQYNQALEEASCAVKYSNNNQRVREQYNRIKSAVDEYYARLDPGKFIRAAEQCFQNGKYDEAIEQAKMAVKYSDNNKKYIKDLNRIQSMIEAKQNELRRLEKEADSHMEAARQLINSGRYDEALREGRAGLACVNSNKYLYQFNSIESIVRRKKAEAQADKAIEKAKNALNNGEYDKALIEARAATNYSSNSKYSNEYNRIKVIVENRKAEIQADRAIEKAKLLINNGEYYKALEEANQALNLSNNHNCHAKYIKEFNNIELSLEQLPKEQLHIIAGEYKRNNILHKAKEWYMSANDARAYYEIGKIDFFKSYNRVSGLSYFKKAADMKYVPALIKLIHIYAKGTSVEKDLHIASKYYKTLRKVDKAASKQVFGVIKEGYKSVLIEKLNIKRWLKKIITKERIIIMSTIILLISSIYVVTMFRTGKWKGKINNASIEISSNIIGLSENEAYQVKLNMIPFFAKEPTKEVVSEDSSIVKIEDGKIQGINEGKTNVILYLDGEEINRVSVTVSKIGVKEFKIHYDGELKLVGDSITPNIEIIYFNDIKKGELNTTYSSSNEDIVRVYKNKLVAIGEGKATVTVKVNDLEKKLIFNIKKEEKPQNSIVESDSKNVNNEFTYETYVNGRYGFSIDHPIDLIANSVLENRDGLLFKNNDGTVSLSVSGANNVSNETAESLYNKDLSKLKVEPVYKSIVENSYAISWKENGVAYYEYYTVGGNNGSIQGFTIKYPDNQNDIYASMVTRIYKSFKPNEIDKVH